MVAMAMSSCDEDEQQHDRGDDRCQDDGVMGIGFHERDSGLDRL
jgi:hypothetical protein